MERNEGRDLADEIMRRSDIHQSVLVNLYLSHQDTRNASIRQVSSDELAVEAAHTSQVRQMVGRYVIKKRWPLYEWYVADRPYLVGLVGIVLILTASLLHIVLGQIIPQHIISITAAGDVAIRAVIMCFSYLMALKQSKWRHDLIKDLHSLDTLTEYDEKRYDMTKGPAQITWAILSLVALVMLLLKYNLLSLTFNSYPPIIFFVSAIIATPTFIVGAYSSIDSDPCWNEIGDEDEELRDTTEEEQEITEELETLILDEIKSLDNLLLTVWWVNVTCKKLLRSTPPLPVSPPPDTQKMSESAGASSVLMVSLPRTGSPPPVLAPGYHPRPQRGLPQYFPRRDHHHPSRPRRRRQEDSIGHGEQPRTLRDLMQFPFWRVRTSVEKNQSSLGSSAASSVLLHWPTYLVQN